MKKSGLVLICSMLFFLAGAVKSEALRCGRDLVLEGDRKIEVLASCGDPATIDTWQETRRVRDFRWGRPQAIHSGHPVRKRPGGQD